jgi:type IV pilus assembly protein PilA
MLPTVRFKAQETGYTLVELLVVILIIGVLAAIAVPSFLNQRGKANDAGAKAIAQTAQTAEETVFTDGERYASQAVGAGAAGALSSVEATLLAPSAACVGSPPYAAGPCGLNATATSDSFQVSVTSATGAVFTIARSSAGVVDRTCYVGSSVDGDGGCSGVVGTSGSW